MEMLKIISAKPSYTAKQILKGIADKILYTQHAVDIGAINGEDRKQYNMGVMELTDSLAKYCED